jgi:hypothetical protein
METALPVWPLGVWFCLAPVALPFAARIGWEKTALTISEGPQMVGFSLSHIHPIFLLFGTLASLLMMVWLVTALIFLVVRRKSIAKFEIVLTCITILAATAILIPDTTFARFH